MGCNGLRILLALVLRHVLLQGGVEAETDLNALDGSLRRFPAGPVLVINPAGNRDLTRLLDVGACITDSADDNTISYVPPLDGTNPWQTLCQDKYFMQFVLFDLQLVELKDIDPVGGSFRAEIQMIFHWVDYLDDGSNVTKMDDCSFLCDNASPDRLCCDGVWVPPLRMSTCDINAIQSSTPQPYLHYSFESPTPSFDECLNTTNFHRCLWRRLWYLNVDATCASHMDFHSFPFDIQSLTIDILNPYASRSWFQVTKGFLIDNIGDDINNVNLSPDSKIPGWYVKNITVSSTCGTLQSWKQSFLAQDNLLMELEDKDNSMGEYESQRASIIDALSHGQLVCATMEDIYNNTSPTNINLYWTVRDKYEERMNSTFEEFRNCIEFNGKNFSWNTTNFDESYARLMSSGALFYTSDANVDRSFNLLNLFKNQTTNKVWFPCAIKAVANLTSPGIRVTILVQRYRMFFVVKLIFPTLACVAFAFTAFGLDPKKLMGRLGVVVPSAIALTALQGFVVATDMPLVAYIAPSTYIILISYFCQLLIAYESIVVKWMCDRKRLKWMERGASRSFLSRSDAPNMHSNSTRFFHRQSASQEEPKKSRSATRRFDLLFMFVVGLLYILSILICIILPWLNAEHLKSHNDRGSISIWPNPSI